MCLKLQNKGVLQRLRLEHPIMLLLKFGKIKHMISDRIYGRWGVFYMK